MRIQKIIVLSAALALGSVSCESEPAGDKTASADKAKSKDKDKSKDADSDKSKDADADEPEDDGDGGGGQDEGDAEDGFSGFDPAVARAAKAATRLENEPERTDEILAELDLDREKLDALMYEIASDPALTDQYRIARGI